MTTAEEKKHLRREAKDRLAGLDDGQRRAASEAIIRRVLESPAYRGADSVFLYLSTAAEPDTAPLLRHALAGGKRVYVPLCTGPHEMKAVRVDERTRFVAGAYGIPEPEDASECAAPEDIDLTLVPCLAAGKDGSRLGHGGGYYDAYLARGGGHRMCLCFGVCLFPALPADERDAAMDAVCTEDGIYTCR